MVTKHFMGAYKIMRPEKRTTIRFRSFLSQSTEVSAHSIEMLYLFAYGCQECVVDPLLEELGAEAVKLPK